VGELLRRLNEILVVDSDVRDYLTLLVVRLDPRGRTVAYASAGHVTGYLLGRNGEVRERLESTGIPLGMFARRVFRSGPSLSLRRGETVVLFTDGLTEIGEPDGRAFGEDRILEFVKNHRHDSASNIVQGLYGAAMSFDAKGPRTDDITIVICKVDAA
jgi:sigma-B regulation protein RsbU (phosphoserine phosphatase)